MKVAIDTNVLAYAEGVDDVARQHRALTLLRALPSVSGCIPVQVLGELFNVLVRKGARTRQAARVALMSWSDIFPTIETTPDILAAATDLSCDHSLSIWDAVIVLVASLETIKAAVSSAACMAVRALLMRA